MFFSKGLTPFIFLKLSLVRPFLYLLKKSCLFYDFFLFSPTLIIHKHKRLKFYSLQGLMLGFFRFNILLLKFLSFKREEKIIHYLPLHLLFLTKFSYHFSLIYKLNSFQCFSIYFFSIPKIKHLPGIIVHPFLYLFNCFSTIFFKTGTFRYKSSDHFI